MIGGSLALNSAFSARGIAQGAATGIVVSDNLRPTLPYGVQTGDLLGDRAILWARASGPARMMVEISTTESFADSWAVRGPATLEDTDYTVKIDLADLPLGQKIHYRVTMVDLADH